MDKGISNQKHLYLVLGMPRSGTSAITRGLKALGVNLGEHLVPAEAQFNPKGVYEDRDIVYKVNRAVTAELGLSWEPVRMIGSMCHNNPKLEPLKKLAMNLLQKRFEDTQHWGFKDPRSSRILPFWQDVFARMPVNVSYIIALRNPLASAYSWHRLNEVEVEYALLLWLNYTLASIDDTKGKNRVLVNYDLMLQNPLKQLERIHNTLNIPLPMNKAEMDAYANEFLDKKLNHYDAKKDERAEGYLALAPLSMKVYELLMKVARDEMTFDSDEFEAAWGVIKQEYAAVYPVYCYIDSLLKKNKEQERKLRTIHKSVPWKLNLPLRLIDDTLRYFRRRTRKKYP